MKNMFIGFLLVLVLFAPLAYFVTRGVVTHAHQSERPLLGVVILFFALLAALSLLSFAMLAAASMFGISLAVGLDALGTSTSVTHPGAVTAIAALVMFIYSTVGMFTGPVCALVTAKIMALVSLVVVLTKANESLSITWLPVVAAGVTVACMWPFTLYLTLGL